jgi:hypothetical protein
MGIVNSNRKPVHGVLRGRRQRDIANELLEARPAEGEQEAVQAESEPVEAFDPSEHSVHDVLAYVEEHPDERDAVRAAERGGKGRVTLLSALD